MRTSAHAMQRGFTLIEMLVATSVAGVLAATAYPSFTAPLHKARRFDGISTLLQVQMGQEQWRSDHARYASLTDLRVATASSQGHYQLAVIDADDRGYTVTATATGAQAHDRGCQVLRLTVSGGQDTRSSGPDERTLNTAADNKRCWGL